MGTPVQYLVARQGIEPCDADLVRISRDSIARAMNGLLVPAVRIELT